MVVIACGGRVMETAGEVAVALDDAVDGAGAGAYALGDLGHFDAVSVLAHDFTVAHGYAGLYLPIRIVVFAQRQRAFEALRGHFATGILVEGVFGQSMIMTFHIIVGKNRVRRHPMCNC